MRLLLLAGVIALGGCAMIDQRTFEAKGKAPDAAELARTAALPPLPLLRIPFGSSDVDFQSDLQAAVDAVQARKPDAQYDVLAPIPTNAYQKIQDVYAANGAADTAAVASGLGYAGVDEDRVHVGYRNDPGAPPREVLVYVR